MPVTWSSLFLKRRIAVSTQSHTCSHMVIHEKYLESKIMFLFFETYIILYLNEYFHLF